MMWHCFSILVPVSLKQFCNQRNKENLQMTSENLIIINTSA